MSSSIARQQKPDPPSARAVQIDTLSGATYSSDAYAQSVQAALDQAHG